MQGKSSGMCFGVSIGHLNMTKNTVFFVVCCCYCCCCYCCLFEGGGGGGGGGGGRFCFTCFICISSGKSSVRARRDNNRKCTDENTLQYPAGHLAR